MKSKLALIVTVPSAGTGSNVTVRSTAAFLTCIRNCGARIVRLSQTVNRQATLVTDKQ